MYPPVPAGLSRGKHVARLTLKSRQRRDDLHPSLNFTDLDRERRQQAFIASLAYKLKQADTFTNPITLTKIIDVAKQNIAIDSGLNVLSFAQQAASLTGGNITYYTLPIDHFGTDPLGEDVNIVNVPLIQATVAHLLYPTTTPAPAPSSSTPTPAHVVVNAVNDSGRSGLADQLEQVLTTGGYRAATASTGSALVAASGVQYGAGAATSATALAAALGGLPTALDSALSPGSVNVVIGTNFTLPTGIATTGSSPKAVLTPATPVQAAGAGVTAPPPSAPYPAVGSPASNSKPILHGAEPTRYSSSRWSVTTSTQDAAVPGEIVHRPSDLPVDVCNQTSHVPPIGDFGISEPRNRCTQHPDA